MSKQHRRAPLPPVRDAAVPVAAAAVVVIVLAVVAVLWLEPWPVGVKAAITGIGVVLSAAIVIAAIREMRRSQ